MSHINTQIINRVEVTQVFGDIMRSVYDRSTVLTCSNQGGPCDRLSPMEEPVAFPGTDDRLPQPEKKSRTNHKTIPKPYGGQTSAISNTSETEVLLIKNRNGIKSSSQLFWFCYELVWCKFSRWQCYYKSHKIKNLQHAVSLISADRLILNGNYYF